MPNYWIEKKQIPRYKINGVISKNPPRYKKYRRDIDKYYNDVYTSLLQLLNKIYVKPEELEEYININKISISHKTRNEKIYYKIIGEGIMYHSGCGGMNNCCGCGYQLMRKPFCFIVIDVYNKKFHCPVKFPDERNINTLCIDKEVKKRLVETIYECITDEKGISEIIFSYMHESDIKKEFITWIPIPENLSAQLDELIPRILEII